MFKVKKTKGFTILEVIIYITIFAAILTVAIFFAWDVIGGQTKSVVITEVNQSSRFILEKVSRDFRQATIINSLSPTTVNFNNIDGDTIIYDFDIGANTLTRQFNAESAVVLNNEAVNITGEWADLSTSQSATISFDLTVEFTSISNQSDWERSLTTSTSYDLNLAS